MPKIGFVALSLLLVLFAGCGHKAGNGDRQPQSPPPLTGEARIEQAWTGEYPVSRLDLLPEGQRLQGTGFIRDPAVFEAVWKAFRPAEQLPEIDFRVHLVLFVRNTYFFNRISIGKVMVQAGVAALLAMETKSAMPIEDQVAMSLVVVARAGITGVQTGASVIPVH